MILVIEGVTCAGKTTMAGRLCKSGEYKLAKEPTPLPVKDGVGLLSLEQAARCADDLLERQSACFEAYFNAAIPLIGDNACYVMDYSPRGCIPFSRALGRWLSDKRFTDQADEFVRRLRGYPQFYSDIIYNRVPSPDYVLDRLKKRGRPGDDAWDPLFLDLLINEYNKEFERC